MRRLIMMLLTLLILPACSSVSSSGDRSPEAAGDHIQTVRDYVDAFNNRSLESMLSLASDDVQWLSIDGAELKVVTNNKAELSSILESYFKECTTCRSRVENMIANDGQVSVLDVTSWQVNGETRSQSALSVYQMDGKLIKRVYYFPAK